MLLQNKIVLVTGGATGIGEATSLIAATEGASVVVADMNAHEGQATAAAIESAGGQAHFVETDVTSSSSVAALVQFIDSQFGRLDVVISCGGVIIFMGSTAGTRVPSGSVAYGASKGGIQGLAYTLEAQLKPVGIRVNVVCPD